MSIEFSPAFGSGTSSLDGAAVGTLASTSAAASSRAARATPRAPSPRRLAANRRNAQRSTGPRSVEGKRRASRNALKHGLCSPHACLETECPATYATFVREVEEELQPRTTLQRSLAPHIANLLWRIDRLPAAQAEMFRQEVERCGDADDRPGEGDDRCCEGEGDADDDRDGVRALSASQVLARRFSEAPADNGFLLIGRYERGLHNQLHRLMARYEWLKKHRPVMPPDEAEVAAEQRRRDRSVDEWVAECAPAPRGGPATGDAPERTQSNPAPIAAGASKTAKRPAGDGAPATERTQRDVAQAGAAPAAACHPAAHPLASSAPRIRA